MSKVTKLKQPVGTDNNAFILLPDGQVIINAQSAPPALELLQDTVGGPIELLHIPLTAATAAGMLTQVDHTPKTAQLIINENGRLVGDLKINQAASAMAGVEIVGVAILLIGGAKIT